MLLLHRNSTRRRKIINRLSNESYIVYFHTLTFLFNKTIRQIDSELGQLSFPNRIDHDPILKDEFCDYTGSYI